MDAVRGGVEATVTVTVDVNADGSPVIVETTYKSESRSGFHRKAFLASATEAVKRWKFRPELVAGHVVPGSGVRIPIDYCLQTSRSEEHTSELPSLMRTSYAVFCLKKK